MQVNSNLRYYFCIFRQYAERYVLQYIHRALIHAILFFVVK